MKPRMNKRMRGVRAPHSMPTPFAALRYEIVAMSVAMSHDANDCDVSQLDEAILYCDVSDDAIEVAASAGAAGYTDPFTRGANCSADADVHAQSSSASRRPA